MVNQLEPGRVLDLEAVRTAAHPADDRAVKRLIVHVPTRCVRLFGIANHTSN
jgi:hypothetical protein